MNKSVPIKILPFVFVFLIAAGSLFAQREIKIQLAFADSLYNSGNYYQAITEYKRFLFFDKDSSAAGYCFSQIAESYKAGGFYGNVENYFRKAMKFEKSINSQKITEVELIRTMILSGKTNRALNELDTFENKFGDSLIADYWRGWTYLLNNQPELASFYFNESLAGKEISERLNKIINDEYSLFNIKLMSYILPGSGQIYTGHYFSGAVSFAWNALFGYMTVKAFKDRRIVEGLLIGDLLWLRFYKGNIQNAERFAKEKNIKLVNQLIENLQNNYKGKKP